jgi:hypothetical protein
MAQRLLSYYKYVGETVGMAGKVKLAQETKIPSTKAALAPDSDANLAIFRAAVEAVTGKPAPAL